VGVSCDWVSRTQLNGPHEVGVDLFSHAARGSIVSFSHSSGNVGPCTTIRWSRPEVEDLLVVVLRAGLAAGVDVADTDRRRGHEESVVSIAAGEQLTELQALQALLLPSANNIAGVLAGWDAGSADRFVARMNAASRSLGMTHTRYTDPSGYDDATVSTAADQVRIVDRAMRLRVFANIVATPSALLPVAGTVQNTNTLLGHDGFVGVKTGSDEAAGGCFAFRAVRRIEGKRTTITGVVLGQPGDDRIGAGLAAAYAIVDRIAGHRTVPDLRQAPAPAPVGAAPDRLGAGRG